MAKRICIMIQVNNVMKKVEHITSCSVTFYSRPWIVMSETYLQAQSTLKQLHFKFKSI